MSEVYIKNDTKKLERMIVLRENKLTVLSKRFSKSDLVSTNTVNYTDIGFDVENNPEFRMKTYLDWPQFIMLNIAGRRSYLP